MRTLNQILGDRGWLPSKPGSHDWVHVHDEGKTIMRIPVGRFPIGTPVRSVHGFTGTVVSVYYSLNGDLRYVCENNNRASITTD